MFGVIQQLNNEIAKQKKLVFAESIIGKNCRNEIKNVQVKPGMRLFFKLYGKFRVIQEQGMKVYGLLYITGQKMIYLRGEIAI